MTSESSSFSADEKDIIDAIVSYVLENNPSNYDERSLPQDTSLLEIGVLDSYGVIELVEFLETNWSIDIDNEEITKEKMGSIHKMMRLIVDKKNS
jgi:acyl carrier protein